MNDLPSHDLATKILIQSSYLQAMGIDTYISRGQVSRCEPIRRFALVASESPGEAVVEKGSNASLQSAMAAVSGGAKRSSGEEIRAESRTAVSPATAVKPDPHRFSLVAIDVGGCLWLEELGNMPLTREQGQLVVNMARALGLGSDAGDYQPEVTPFNWPIHNNSQLAQGPEAAAAALAGFLNRKLDSCRALVVLGAICSGRLPERGLSVVPRVQIPSTLEMLGNPSLKRSAWDGLSALAAELQ